MEPVDRSGGPLSRRAMLTTLGLLAFGAAPALVACSEPDAPRAAGPRVGGQAGPITVSRANRDVVSLSTAPHLPQVVRGMDALAAHLHAVAATTSTNFTVSPLSIAVAFGMLRAGSRGATGDAASTTWQSAGPRTHRRHRQRDVRRWRLWTFGPAAVRGPPGRAIRRAPADRGLQLVKSRSDHQRLGG
jgi:hypothetical protein